VWEFPHTKPTPPLTLYRINIQAPVVNIEAMRKRTGVMKLLAPVMQLVSLVREFMAPRYRPELHYMRGPGPAFARRMAKQSRDRYA
jgi:hypothetical protein